MTSAKHRILLITDTYPPVLGGSEIEAQRVSAGLIRRGHAVHVVCADAPPMPRVSEWVDPEGVPVAILARGLKNGRLKEIAFALQVARRIQREKNRFDIVYFLNQGLHLAAGLPVAHLLGIPVVVKISGSTIIPLMRRARAGRFELDWLQRRKVPVMLLNEGMINEAIEDGFERTQLCWMPNPVDVDVFRPAGNREAADWRARHGVPEGAPAVTYVGRLSREKGLPELLRGFAEALRQEPAAILLVIGDGPLRGELESMSRQLSLSAQNVRFIGRVPFGDVPLWLRASDIYALTSPNEGFPCALLEAMSSGLSSVVSDIPANLQLVDDGIHGLTTPWNDARQIGAALLRLLGDPALRKRMGEAARNRVVENYSMDRVLERYERLLDDVRSPGKSALND